MNDYLDKIQEYLIELDLLTIITLLPVVLVIVATSTIAIYWCIKLMEQILEWILNLIIFFTLLPIQVRKIRNLLEESKRNQIKVESNEKEGE